MADATLRGMSRKRALGAGVGLLAALLLVAPGTARAFEQLKLQFPSTVLVRGAFLDSGDFLTAVASFSVLDLGETTPGVVDLILQDFEIIRTSGGGGIANPHFEFTFENPAFLGVYDQATRNIALSWDLATGRVLSESFNVRMNLLEFGAENGQVDYSFQLDTATTTAINCNAKSLGALPGFNGVNLPPGPLSGTSSLRFVAKGCGTNASGLQAGLLQDEIVVLSIGAAVPEPGTLLLVASGLAGLAFAGRRRS